MNSLGNFSISMRECMDFARVSGDFNPLHVDQIASRRTRYGEILIHGACGVLKTLDLLLQKRGTAAEIVSIKVKYNKPAVLNQTLEVFEQTTEGVTRLDVLVDGNRCQVIELELIDARSAARSENAEFRECTNATDTPEVLSIDDCNGLSGMAELYWSNELMRVLFPSATKLLPARQLAVLLASSQIIGMKCPGLHSVSARLSLHFSDTIPDAVTIADTQLEYRVLKTDPRIDWLEVGLRTAFAEGSVEAFFRSPPVTQASFKHIQTLVSASEFSAQNALVIGGSRGIGEVITKVLAAGGASVMATYAVGKKDALGVSAEIGLDKARPPICAYNVLDGAMSEEMLDFCATVTHIYYLASPVMAKNESSKWDKQLFTRYCDFYIDGLSTLLQQIMQHDASNRDLQVFMPSSLFLEKSVKGFDEFIAAKSAAEVFAKCFERSHRNCTIVAPRLPTLFTDQTSGLKNAGKQQTHTVIIDQLRAASAALPQ